MSWSLQRALQSVIIWLTDRSDHAYTVRLLLEAQFILLRRLKHPLLSLSYHHRNISRGDLRKWYLKWLENATS